MQVAVLSIEDREALRSSDICRNMNDAMLENIVAHGSIIEREKSAFLFEQGAQADRVFIVLNGWIQIKRVERDGSDTMIAVFQKGQSLAEIAALLERPYPVSAQAMTAVRLFAIRSSELIELLQQDSGVLSSVLGSLYQKLHVLVNEVEALKSRTLKERLAMFLLENIAKDGNSKVLTLPYDKSLIAARIGTSPEQLSRTFKGLKEFGVTIEGRIAQVEDPEILRQMLLKT
ncbi:Crp/Fnr family transcriptional regulator [Primorskyibacter sp. S187A]|uniref:Crp/Fnr family transcriptional regulator n=1 Tax=Primorskyibacter sp. S187A TaxID=3415130 RepID=UPI003C7E46B4